MELLILLGRRTQQVSELLKFTLFPVFHTPIGYFLNIFLKKSIEFLGKVIENMTESATS